MGTITPDELDEDLLEDAVAFANPLTFSIENANTNGIINRIGGNPFAPNTAGNEGQLAAQVRVVSL